MRFSSATLKDVGKTIRVQEDVQSLQESVHTRCRSWLEGSSARTAAVVGNCRTGWQDPKQVLLLSKDGLLCSTAAL